jgi:GH15 family glucan-1,4-alpha-glucosidase
MGVNALRSRPTSSSIGDYALIGDCETAALVSRQGSIDWLCWPRFDSPACFAALLGTPANGHWRIAPVGQFRTSRRYRSHTLILETTFTTIGGQVTLIDFMALRDEGPRLIRIIQGDRGSVRLCMALRLRLDYGRRVPSLRVDEGHIMATGSSFRLVVLSPISVQSQHDDFNATFTVRANETLSFELGYADSSRHKTTRNSPIALLRKTERWWHRWTSRLKYHGPYSDAVERSLITLKALTYAPTGGMVAAPTTSIPEIPGGPCNWDYRYCWLRDATFTLLGFIHTGYGSEARAWKDWLLRAVGQNPGRLRVLYDVMGKTVNKESKVSGLGGYQTALPVRVGNSASNQLQLDIFGEVSDVLFQAGISKKSKAAYRLLIVLLARLERIWRLPDHGIWEMRNGTRQFTYSKVMCWVAFDRAIRAAEEIGFRAPLNRWRAVRQEIHGSVCRLAYNSRLGSFMESYRSRKVDASLLLLPLVGFLPPDDRRIGGTVRLIEKRLMRNGFIMRTEGTNRRKREGAFLPCSFWLADCYELTGRVTAAKRLLNRLMKIRNDVGLLSEEYHPGAKHLTGNFPQALSHVALINTVINLHTKFGPSYHRSSQERRKLFL